MPGFLAYAQALPNAIALRPATDADRDFLAGLYASTREEEMMLATTWSDAQKRAFLHDQFALQDQHYRLHYPNAERLVVERGGASVGRVLINVTAAEVRLMDIALLPVARGHGIGSALVARVLVFADALGVPVTLHVEPFNPVLRMYEREGFMPVEMRGIYQFMRRPARSQLKTAS